MQEQNPQSSFQGQNSQNKQTNWQNSSLPNQNPQHIPQEQQSDQEQKTTQEQQFSQQQGSNQDPASTNNTATPYFPDYQKPIQEELVYQWQAPSRPFKKHKRQYFTTIATIILLLCLILFFAGQFLPIAVVIAVGFLSYIMATIPPQMVTNSITTFGIRNEDDLYYWDELGRFWFDKKHEQDILYIEVDRFPFRLTLLIADEPQEILAEIISEILPNQKPPLTEVEKIAKWLQKKIPLDIDS